MPISSGTDTIQPKKKGNGPIAKRYEALRRGRSSVERKARNASRLTIPDLMPEAGSNDNTEGYVPFQSLGDLGVTTLSGAMNAAYLPPGFGGIISLEQSTADGQKAMTEEKRAKTFGPQEKIIHQALNTSGIRSGFNTGLQHLLVTGNACAYISSDRSLRIYRCDQYVVNRQPDGTIMEVIAHDQVDILSLPEEIAMQCEDYQNKMDSDDLNSRLVDIYTHTIRANIADRVHEHPLTEFYEEKKPWYTFQEVEGNLLHGGVPIKRRFLPYIPGRYSANAGEHWGRGLVYEMRGDLETYEALSKAIREAAAAQSRIVFLVNPAGVTDYDEVNEAENGAAIEGRPGDVEPLVADLRANLSVAEMYAAKLEERISQQFLMVGGYKRDAERVTATEKQMDAAELENRLGGSFTYLSKEFLEPILLSFIEKLVMDGELPEEILDRAEVNVITGYSALGRQQRLQRARLFFQDAAVLGDTVFKYLNMSEFLNMLMKEHGIDATNLIKSEQEVQQSEAQSTAGQALAGSLPTLLDQGINQ